MKSKFYWFFLFSSFILLLFITLITIVNSKYFVIAHDDVCECFINTKLTLLDNFLFNVYHGRYISNIFTKLQCGLFDIHPVTWIRTYGAVLKSIFLFIFVMLLAASAFLQKKGENYQIIKYILMPIIAFSIYIFYHFAVYGIVEDMLHTYFYGFTFPFIIFFLYWNKFFDIYLNNKEINKFDKKYLIICAFLLGISTEFTIIVSFFSLIILLLYNLVIKNKSFKNFYFSIFAFFVATPLYFLNPGFISSGQGKGTFNGIENMYNTAIAVLPEFINDAIVVIPKLFLPFVVPIILLSLFLLFNNNKEQRNKYMVIIASFIISIFAFYFLLLFAGRGPGDILFSKHFSTNLQIQIGLIYLLLLVINFIDINKIFKISILIIFILCLVFSQEMFINTIRHINYIKIENYQSYGGQEISNERYIFETILLHYLKKNEKPILPKDEYSFSVELGSYLASVYNIKNFDENELIFVDKTEAYDLYLKNGGKQISEEELKIADFQKFKKVKLNSSM